MSEKILIANGITKSFGRLKVLNGIDLTIDRGDRYILFGSNGAGKTTLVKILSTILPADSGDLTIFGRKIKKPSKDVKTLIGFMSHEPYLYNELTAWENLNFYASLYSVKDKEEQIKNLLNEVGLSHRLNDRIGSFSRGMKQRLSIARTILHSPDIIFLDEPYTGLDIRAQEILNNIIIRLNNEGKTFFLITHDINRGCEIASRRGLLSQGKIVYEDYGGKNKEFLVKLRDTIKGEMC